MEPKILAIIASFIGFPSAAIAILADIGALTLNNWRITLFAILGIIFTSIKIYWYHRRKQQEHKIRDLEIKERERAIDRDIFS